MALSAVYSLFCSTNDVGTGIASTSKNYCLVAGDRSSRRHIQPLQGTGRAGPSLRFFWQHVNSVWSWTHAGCSAGPANNLGQCLDILGTALSSRVLFSYGRLVAGDFVAEQSILAKGLRILVDLCRNLFSVAIAHPCL